jgi:nicotinic acid mononucleotide adenylyltransferase
MNLDDRFKDFYEKSSAEIINPEKKVPNPKGGKPPRNTQFRNGNNANGNGNFNHMGNGENGNGENGENGNGENGENGEGQPFKPERKKPVVIKKNIKKPKNDHTPTKKETEKVIDLSPSLNREAVGTRPAVFTFGRMNPPTIGHEKLVRKVQLEAKKNSGLPYVYLSHTEGKKTDPIPYKHKIRYAKKAFGKNIVIESRSRTIIQILKELQTAGHKSVTMVVGSDRVREFDRILNKYNGKDYTFESINVVSAGQRDPDAEGLEGMSASKMRDLVREKKFTEFQKGLPRKIKRDFLSISRHIKDEYEIDNQINLLFEDHFLADEDLLEMSEEEIDAAIEEEMENEEIEFQKELDAIQELSPKTVSSYQKKAGKQYRKIPYQSSGHIDTAHLRGHDTSAQTDKKYKDQETRQKRGRGLALSKGKGAVKEDVENVDEVLTLQARRKRALMLKRMMPRIMRARKLKKNRMATPEMLRRRALRAARTIIRRKIIGAKGANYAKLSVSMKIQLDKRVATKQKIIQRIAKRLAPKIRQKEMVRLRNAKSPKDKKGGKKMKAAKIMTTNEAIINKAVENGLDVNELFEEYQLGREDPHGSQTPEQGGFARMSTYIAEQGSSYDKKMGRKKAGTYGRTSGGYTPKFAKQSKRAGSKGARRVAKKGTDMATVQKDMWGDRVKPQRKVNEDGVGEAIERDQDVKRIKARDPRTGRTIWKNVHRKTQIEPQAEGIISGTGKAIKWTAKKAVAGVKYGAKRASTAGRADSAEKTLKRLQKRKADRERLAKAKSASAQLRREGNEEEDKKNPVAKKHVGSKEWKALHDMDDSIINDYVKHKETNEEWSSKQQADHEARSKKWVGATDKNRGKYQTHSLAHDSKQEHEKELARMKAAGIKPHKSISRKAKAAINVKEIAPDLAGIRHTDHQAKLRKQYGTHDLKKVAKLKKKGKWIGKNLKRYPPQPFASGQAALTAGDIANEGSGPQGQGDKWPGDLEAGPKTKRPRDWDRKKKTPVSASDKIKIGFAQARKRKAPSEGVIGSVINQLEPEYSEKKREIGNKLRKRIGIKQKPKLDWKKARGVSEAEDPEMKRLKDAHKSEKETQKDSHVKQLERLKIRKSRNKIRATSTQEMVDVMNDVDMIMEALELGKKKNK